MLKRKELINQILSTVTSSTVLKLYPSEYAWVKEEFKENFNFEVLSTEKGPRFKQYRVKVSIIK